MSTFMAYGAVDLRAGVAADGFVTALAREVAGEKDANRPLDVWVTPHGERIRITLCGAYANIWLAGVVARAARDVDRVLLGLDHDEYGAEHTVLDGRSGSLLRVHHVYVYPDGGYDGESMATLVDVPARSDLAVGPDGTLTGADALAAAAALYDIGADRIVRAVRETADAHEYLQIVFRPLAPWWDALGVTYPYPDLGEPTTTIGPRDI